MSNLIKESDVNKILTWHSDADLKARVLKSYDGHIAADTLIKGEYFGGDEETFKGCHIGCVVKELGGNDKNQYPELTGLPDWLMGLNEYFFEHMPHPQNQKITRDILEAIPEGKDISLVENRFLIWLLTDETHGSIRHCDDDGRKATLTVAALHERVLVGDKPSQDEWAAARDVVRATASYVVRAAARDAAWAAVSDAAWAAAKAAASDVTRAAQSEKLIELLKAEQ